MPGRRRPIVPVEHEESEDAVSTPEPPSPPPRERVRASPPAPPPLEAVTDRQRADAEPGEIQVMPAPVVGVNPVLRLMRQLSDGIVNGTDLQQFQGDVERLISGQTERAQAFDSLGLTNEYGRQVRFMEAREKLESFMLTCANRGDLSPAETLAFLRYVDEHQKRGEDRIRAGATDVKDIVALLEKMDHLRTLDQRAFEDKLRATTPTGREIVRRSALKLAKLAKASKRVSTAPRHQAVPD